MPTVAEPVKESASDPHWRLPEASVSSTEVPLQFNVWRRWSEPFETTKPFPKVEEAVVESTSREPSCAPPEILEVPLLLTRSVPVTESSAPGVEVLTPTKPVFSSMTKYSWFPVEEPTAKSACSSGVVVPMAKEPETVEVAKVPVTVSGPAMEAELEAPRWPSTFKAALIVEEAVEMNPASVERESTERVVEAPSAPPTSSVPFTVDDAPEMNPPFKYERPVVVALLVTKNSPSIVEEAVEMNPASVEREPTERVEEAESAPPTSSVLLIVEEAFETKPLPKYHALLSVPVEEAW